MVVYLDSLAQDCSNSIANALELLQSCTKPWISPPLELTHWGRVRHICVGKLTIIGSDNGLSPERRQAIIWTNAGILLIRPLGTNSSEILIEIHTFPFKKIHLKMKSAKFPPFCLGLNVLRHGWAMKSHCYIDVITHPCPIFCTGLAKLCR